MKHPRRIRIRSAKHYTVFRLEDEVTLDEMRQSTRGPVRPPRTQLLALAMRSSQRAQSCTEAESPHAQLEPVGERVA